MQLENTNKLIIEIIMPNLNVFYVDALPTPITKYNSITYEVMI